VLQRLESAQTRPTPAHDARDMLYETPFVMLPVCYRYQSQNCCASSSGASSWLWILLVLATFPSTALAIFRTFMFVCLISCAVDLTFGFGHSMYRWVTKKPVDVETSRRSRARVFPSRYDPLLEHLAVLLLNDDDDDKSPCDLSGANIVASKANYTITVTAPGVRRDDLTVETAKGYLRVAGNTGGYCVNRSVPLPKGANVDEATATYAHGSLEVRLPRRQPHVRTIQVTESTVQAASHATPGRGVEANAEVSTKESTTPATTLPVSVLLAERPASPSNVQAPEERCDVVETGEEEASVASEEWESVSGEPSKQ